MSKGCVKFHDLHSSANDLLHDVIEGLSQSPRTIAPKYFYNEQGSKLFDAITETQDYYPTRTEYSILSKFKQDIVEHLAEDCLLIEPGGGSCAKVRVFIEDLRPFAYVPLDISKQHLLSAAEQLVEDYPWLTVHAICGDFTMDIKLPNDLPGKQRVMFFPGSSVGNFHPTDAVAYMSKLASIAGKDGQLLIGVDLKKNKQILERAYDDSEGVTAEFNLNLLSRFNRELSANFDISGWTHHALYNEAMSRIEMHLKSLYEQVVNIGEHEFYFAENETMHTENSYKYTVEEFQALALQAGFNLEKVWVDAENLFSVHLFKVEKS